MNTLDAQACWRDNLMRIAADVMSAGSNFQQAMEAVPQTAAHNS
jgi:hypothetical protein